MNKNIQKIVEFIKKRVKIKPNSIGVILGACFSDFLDEIENKTEILFSEITDLKSIGTDTQENKFVFGTLKNKSVIVILGRIHFSFGYEYKDVATPIFVLKELGCEKLVLCASVGSINKKIKVGDIVTIDDHLNFTGRNPLIACNYDNYGHKFTDMIDPYDKQMIDRLLYVAKKEMSIKVKRGVLIEFSGPSAETVSESNFAEIIGADFIGFNICCEVIAAKYCKLPVVAYALVTNFASAFTSSKIKHEDIVYNRKCASTYYLDLLSAFIAAL